MIQDEFFKRLHDAEAAGLNKEAALEVAYKLLTLDEALGIWIWIWNPALSLRIQQ